MSISHPYPFDGLSPFSEEYKNLLNEVSREAYRFTELHESIESKLLEVAQTIRAQKGGVAVVGKVASVVTGPYLDPNYNFNYTVELLDGTVLPAMEPWDRRFDPAQVDHEKLDVGDQVTLFPLPPNPFTVPVAPDGGCLDTNGDCTISNAFGCGGGTFLGEGVPCANLYAAEYVKISTCPAPVPSMGPPPRIIDNAGLLS